VLPSDKNLDTRELSLEDLEAQEIMELPERTALSIVQSGVMFGALPVPVGRFVDLVPPTGTM
jgi:hypothetical protein